MVASTTTEAPKFELPKFDFDAATARFRSLNEQLIEQGKKQGNANLDSWEKAVQSIVDFQKKAAEASQLDFVKTLTDTHVKFVSSASEAYVKAARELLK